MKVRECKVFIYMYVLNHIYKLRSNKIVFTAMGGGYNDSSRAVSEKLHNADSSFEIYWYFEKGKENDIHIPGYVHKITNYKEFLFHLSTAKFWATCGYHNHFYYKSRKQFAITFWHGDRAIKKILCDAGHTVANETNHSDLMTSGSLFYEELTKSAFCYTGELLKTGCPRNDLLNMVDNNYIYDIKKQLSISLESKVLLYAPTFRDHSLNKQTENLDIERTLSVLENKTGEKWICLGRFHPKTQGMNRFNSDKIIDVSAYYDMVDLLCIADCLITDYSSSATDYIIREKPMFLFQPDRKSYAEQDRSFYFDMDKSPFLIATNQEELETLISNSNQATVSKNCCQIADFYGMYETGHASDDVVKYIIQRK